jgi:glycosyltransferase involved in cell wall biosynthesis
MVDLSVIVATKNRPQLLSHALCQYRSQIHSLKTECLVVSDGPDPRAASTAEYYGCRYISLAESANDWGATPNDVGVQNAAGRYVVFWNDDNLYYPRNLKCLYAAAHGFDIGVCQTVHWNKQAIGPVIPKQWDGGFRYAEIDAMCVCVRKEVALRATWARPDAPYECDLRWLEALVATGVSINYEAVVIGEHL